eukprot:757407-Hanusia_phi.AAC.2
MFSSPQHSDQQQVAALVDPPRFSQEGPRPELGSLAKFYFDPENRQEGKAADCAGKGRYGWEPTS